MRRNLTYKLGGLLFWFVHKLFTRRDPLKAERFGLRLAWFGFVFGRKQRKRALSNLALAMPELDPKARKDLAYKCFQHFGMVTMDFLRASLWTEEEIRTSIVAVDASDKVLAAVEGNDAVIVLSGHFGSWERLASWLVLLGRNVTLVQRDANDPSLNETMTDLRGRPGISVVSRGNAVRGILSAIKAGNAVGLLADQNSSEAFLPFFGHPAGTTLGPAIMHIRTGAPLIPAFCVRTGPCRFKVVIHDPLEAEPGAESPAESIMAKYNLILEQMTRNHPEQWLWFHNRWKSARGRGLVPRD